MNRASHVTTSAITHKAMLSVRTHAKDHYTPIRASQEYGCLVSHALPTQALPSMTGDSMDKPISELLDELDELIDALDRLNETIRLTLEELEAGNG